jgi:hypothetical protein
MTEGKKIQTAVRNFSEEGLEAVTNNLKPQVKHSYHYFKRHPNRIAMTCDMCPFKSQCEYSANQKGECVPVLDYQKEIVDELFSLPHIKSQDKFLVYRFAHIQARLMVIDKWLSDIAGNFKIANDTINVQPITRARNEDEKTLIKLSDKLCLSPDARSKLGVAYATYSLARSLMNVSMEDDD